MQHRFLYRVFSLLLVIGLLLVAYPVGVKAMPAGTWQTGIKIQNLSSTEEATLIVDLYAPAGGAVATSISTTSTGQPLKAAAGGSVEVFLPSYSITAGQYSAVVSSNVEVGVVVTNTNYTAGLADSYNAMAPGKQISVPTVYHAHNSWSTEIFMQNTSATQAANVTVNFVEPSNSGSAGDGVAVRSVPVVIPAAGVASLDTSTAQFGTGGTYDLGWFIGAATIQSDVDLAVAINQVRVVGSGDVRGNVMVANRGLSAVDGGTKVLLPSLYKTFGGNGSWQSGIKVQNVSGSTAHVTIQFAGDPGYPAFNGVNTMTIQPGLNEEFYLPTGKVDGGATAPDWFKGYAVVTSDVAVVASVLHTNYGAADNFGVAVGYAGFATGADKLSLPSLYVWPSGAGVWISGIKVQNLGGSSATFTVKFTADPDSFDKTTATTGQVTLGPGEAYECYMGSVMNPGGINIPQGWKGSAVVTATDTSAELVATVLHTNYGRHVANMYTGVPYP